MALQAEPDRITSAELTELELHVHGRLVGRVSDFQLQVRNGGLVLRGRAHTYYAKQLAQHAVMQATSLPIQANEIQAS